MQIDYRWGGQCRRRRKYAAELVALAPDVILASGSTTVRPLLQVTRTVPIVFVQVPIRSARASSIAWRGRVATPPVSLNFEYSLSAKWLELLKEIAPERDASGGPSGPRHTAGIGQFGAIQSVAPSFGVEVSPSTCATPMRSSAPSGIRARRQWRPDRDGERVAVVHRDLIISLAARHKLPAVYYRRALRYRRRPDLLWA